MTKSNIKRLMVLPMAISVLFTLSGCRLAKEEQESAELFGDKLVGCYITTEPIPDGKIYATLVEIEEDSITHGEYVFEKYDGIPFYATTISANADHEDYDINCFGDEVCNKHTAWNTNENTGVNSEEASGTIYYTEEKTVYMNPVYQEKDGDVYMYKAEMGDLVNKQGESTTSISGTATYTENDEKISETFKVSTTFVYKQEPDKIKFVYMSEENEVVKEEDFAPGNTPTEINVPNNVEYILVETYGYDSLERKDTVTREIYDRDDIFINTFMENGKGFCIQTPTEIIWE